MEEDREEEGAPDLLVFSLHRRRVNPCAASGGGTWEDAPPLFSAPEAFPALFLHVLEALDCFWVCFCNFELFDVIVLLIF